MDLTPENKAVIEGKGLYQLLASVKFLRRGDPWMTGETGAYFLIRLREFRHAAPGAFALAAERIGWLEPTNWNN